MSRKLPQDAFAFYVALGQPRTYETVAKQFGVNRRTVVRIAVEEKWMKRLAEIERRAREEADLVLTEDLKQMHLRHRTMLRAIATRAAMALQGMELNSAMEGVKAAEIAIKLERLLAGEATEARTVNIEAIVRDEQQRFLEAVPAEEAGEQLAEATLGEPDAALGDEDDDADNPVEDEEEAADGEAGAAG